MASGTASTWQPAPVVGSGWLSQELQEKDRCNLDHRTQRGAETTIVAFPVAFPDGVVYVQATADNALRELTATIPAAQSLGQVGEMVYYSGQIVQCHRCSLRFRSPQPCQSLVCPDCTLPIELENVEDFVRANAHLPPNRDVQGLINAKQATGKAAQLQSGQSSSYRDEVYNDAEGGTCAGGNILGR